jgi:ParB-like chromosome segregation protein Spo0J
LEPTVRCEHSELVDPKTLVDHPQNANKHPKNQIKALAGNINKFGWRHPIVVSKRSGCIVAGHGRRDAALMLGCQAPVDLQDFESEDEELAVLVSDNVIPELAEMDTQLLEQNKELLEAAGFDLEVIGFEILEVPDFKPEGGENQPRLDEKEKIICPNCNHEFEK